MAVNWKDLKREIHDEVEKVWLKEPLEVTMSKLGVFPSGAGTDNQILGNLFFQGPLGGMELFAQTQSICKQHYIPARIKLWRRRFSHDTIVLLLFPCRCVEKPTASTLYHTGELHHQQPPQ